MPETYATQTLCRHCSKPIGKWDNGVWYHLLMGQIECTTEAPTVIATPILPEQIQDERSAPIHWWTDEVGLHAQGQIPPNLAKSFLLDQSDRISELYRDAGKNFVKAVMNMGTNMIKISQEHEADGRTWWRVAIDFSKLGHEPAVGEFVEFALAVDFARDWVKDNLGG